MWRSGCVFYEMHLSLVLLYVSLVGPSHLYLEHVSVYVAEQAEMRKNRDFAR